MTKSLLIKSGLFAIAMASPVLMSAGNIPQYGFSEGTELYFPLQNATAIHTIKDTKTAAIFSNGSVSSEGQVAMGFPIGFDFVYGGQTVNQFVPTTHGAVFFGKDYVRVESVPSLALKAGDHMGYVSMVAGVVPADDNIKSGNISYLTTGEAGNRVCTIQFEELNLDEKSNWSNGGVYSVQVRLYEKDNTIEFAIDEVEAPAWENKLFIGLRGWDSADGKFLKSNNLRLTGCQLSEATSASSTNYEAVVKWDNYDNPNFDAARLCYRFTPSTEQGLPAAGPQNLDVVQEEDDLIITCEKADGADATVILISETPFTDADYPVDGATFPIKAFQSGDKYVSKFGKATALYYGADEKISIKYKGVKSATTYYVAAVSANGVPMYDKAHANVFICSAANEAPSNVSVMPGEKELTVSWESEVDAIVAMTTERLSFEEQKYPYRTAGTFGRPTVDVKEGDMLEGGGKVVYVGSDKQVTVTVPKNEMVYFALWSKEGDVISAKYTSSCGVTYPSIPYEPKLEKRNYNLVPQGWTTTDDGFSYRVLRRAGDNEDALYAYSENDEPVLESPLITLPDNSIITFEYSLETAADASMSFGGDPGKGTVPGYFGYDVYDSGDEDHRLWVAIGEEEVGSVNSYDGEMKKNDGGSYIRGTSEFLPFKAEVAKLENNRGRLRIGFRTRQTSELWLRNIKIETGEGSGSAVEGVEAENVSFITGGKGFVKVFGDKKVDIYSVDGRKVATVNGPATVQLPAGIYIADGCKVMVK